MEIHMAIQTGHPKAGLRRFAIVGGVELFLRELGDEHPQAVELRGRDQAAEQPVEILRMENFPLGNVAEFGMRGQKDGGREFRKEAFRQIEVHIEAFQAWEFFNLQWWKHLASDGLLHMGKAVEALWKQ